MYQDKKIYIYKINILNINSIKMQMKLVRSDYLAHFNVPITFVYDDVFFFSLSYDVSPSTLRQKKFTLPPGKIIIVSINGGTTQPRHAISHLTCAKINLI